MSIAVAAGVMTALGATLGALLGVSRRRLEGDDDALVEAVDHCLPQTQCAQCGYPGCRPYAEAIAAGEAINLCPPGGPDTVQSLSELLGRPAVALAEPAAGPQLALIDEQRCIGCALCLDACPVDAIVGAPGYLHTVLPGHCTGCELCLPPCPVDCIALTPRAA